MDEMTQQRQDEAFMQRALQLAKQGAEKGEVPVGAVVVLDGEIIGEGYNAPISTNDPTAHAEVQALRDAAQKVGNYRLPETTLYVTLEPCTMCAGALVHSRVAEVVYGTTEPKAGVVESQSSIFESPHFNHQVQSRGGVLAEECAVLLKVFFKSRR